MTQTLISPEVLFLVFVLAPLFFTWLIFREADKEDSTTSRTPTHTKDRAQLSDCEIHYTQTGKGDYLVLLHGWGANIFCWRYLTPLLAQHYRVVEIDLPGFGQSTKVTHVNYGLDDQVRRITEFMKELKIAEAHFVGSSMGSAISLWLAAKHPELVKSVVALAPAANKKIMPTSLHKISPLGWAIPRFLGPQIARFSFSQVVSRQELVTSENVMAYLTPFLNNPNSRITMLKAAEAIRDSRLPGDLKFVRAPVLVLYGEKDKLIKRKYIEELVEVLPRSTKFETHPTAGHHPQEDEPQWVYQNICKFLDISSKSPRRPRIG